jgi:hypothetical protein
MNLWIYAANLPTIANDPLGLSQAIVTNGMSPEFRVLALGLFRMVNFSDTYLLWADDYPGRLELFSEIEKISDLGLYRLFFLGHGGPGYISLNWSIVGGVMVNRLGFGNNDAMGGFPDVGIYSAPDLGRCDTDRIRPQFTFFYSCNSADSPSLAQSWSNATKGTSFGVIGKGNLIEGQPVEFWSPFPIPIWIYPNAYDFFFGKWKSSRVRQFSPQ